MSGFGYRRGLSKYEDLDEDELLASLTDEELKELEKELEDIDPDPSLPVGHRQKSLTEKTPTGTFSREALMAYWERETKKLLEKERMGACEQDYKQEEEEEEEEGEEEGDDDGDGSEEIKEEYFTGSNSEISEEAHNEEDDEENKEDENEEEENNEEEEEEEEEDEREEASSTDDEEESVEECEKLPNTKKQTSLNIKLKNYNENEIVTNGHSEKEAEYLNYRMGAMHPCGNPTVIEDALEKVRSNDTETTEVNLNNIENITPQMLTHFAQALQNNTEVKTFNLANTHADDNVAMAIAGMLKVNEHIVSLNLDSNFITGKGILAIMRALQNNKVLTELRFHNQRHIMGSQAEMDMVKLLRDNATIVKLGYHFELAGPRMSMTSILTRNMDKQRQKRMQEQKEQQSSWDGGLNPKAKALQKGTPGSSPYSSPRSSPWSSPKISKKVSTPQNQLSPPKSSPMPSPKILKKSTAIKNQSPFPPQSPPPARTAPPPPPPPPPSPPPPPHLLPPPPPPPPQIVVEKKAPTRNIAEVIKQQESAKRALQNKQKKKKSKKNKQYDNAILKEIKNSLKSIPDNISEEGSRPSSRPSTPVRSLHSDLMEAIRGSNIRQLRRVEIPEALR
ncbi:leiomodin-2 [Notechis scutatus]|uniref:Leiomodin-2 n=1 Tax=Notechis scutatus TaxID=8663 RepID=A0A6J1UAN9_9SAUR|nr:leiomodin-2 [Notechis scutatus]